MTGQESGMVILELLRLCENLTNRNEDNYSWKWI